MYIDVHVTHVYVCMTHMHKVARHTYRRLGSIGRKFTFLNRDKILLLDDVGVAPRRATEIK